MSTYNQRNNTGQQLTTDYDNSKIFIWNNRTIDALYNNSVYSDVTLYSGTLMGRVTSTGFVKPLVSSASDGSQVPIGILNETRTFGPGFLGNVSLVISGQVVEPKVILATGDTLDTTVASAGESQRLRDRIAYMGIILVPSTEITEFDN